MTNQLLISVLFAGILALAVLGAGVTWQNQWLEASDAAALQMVVLIRSPGLTTFMIAASWLGTWFVYLVVLVTGLAVHRQKGWSYLIIALVSLLFAQLARTLINFLVHRPRPPRSSWLVHANNFAFPSGHTVLTVVGFGLAAWLIWSVDRQTGMVAAGVTVVLSLLVAASRVYLRVHWASDVIGSLMFGVVWLAMTLLIARTFFQLT
jgi:membrane-associated phospholipid phosphatase